MWAPSISWLRPSLRQIRTLVESVPSSSIKPASQNSKFSSSAIVRQDVDYSSLPSAIIGQSTLSSSRSSRGGLARSEPFILHVQSTRNNTILTLTTPQGAPISHVSSGMVGFKKSARSGYEAGHQTAMKMFQVIDENRVKWRCANLHLIFKGFGVGREAVFRALMTQEGSNVRNLIRKMSDATRIKVGGVRPKKIRML